MTEREREKEREKRERREREEREEREEKEERKRENIFFFSKKIKIEKQKMNI